jgi:hypothetical protein
MFGIPIASILSWITTYGPAAVKAVQTLVPVIQAAIPQIEAMIAAGATHTEATNAVAAYVSAFDVEQAMQARSSQPAQGGG